MFEKMKENNLTFGELFSVSWEIFKKNFAFIAFLLLLLFIPIALYIPTGLLEIARKIALEVNEGDALRQLLSFVLLVGIVKSLVTIIIMMVTENTIQEQREGLQVLVVKGLRRFLPWFFSMVMLQIVLLILGVLFVLPLVLAGPFLAFAGHAAVLRNRFGTGALAHSKNVVTGNWGRVFGLFALIFLASFLFNLVMQKLALGFAGYILVEMGTSFVTIFIQILTTVLFLNLSYIKDSIATLFAPKEIQVSGVNE